MNLQVNEIFASIQGEGYWTGLPCVFLRLQGCNLDPPCAWCDTPQAQRPSLPCEDICIISINDALDRINSFKPCTVVVTGGEPMMQSDALMELIKLDYGQHKWHLETNGTLSTRNIFSWITVSPKSGHDPCHGTMCMADEVKIVISCMDDIITADKLYHLYHKRIWLQPVSNDPEMIKMCVDWLLSIPSSEQLFGLSVQVHKLIGVK